MEYKYAHLCGSEFDVSGEFQNPSLRFVSCFRCGGFFSVLGFVLFQCYHEASVTHFTGSGYMNPKAGVIKNKEGIKPFQG